MKAVRLRIAVCEECGSSGAIVGGGTFGYCSYCPRPAPRASRRRWWPWVLLGFLAGLLR